MQAGTLGANRLYAHTGNDRLQVNGGTGNLLNAGPGTDVLIAGTGTDTFVGSAGNDVFRFLSTAASTPSSRDILQADGSVAAFERPGGGQVVDRFDLTGIDANAVAGGTQHFVFGTSHAAGRLWAEDSGTLTLIRGNTDHDTAVEFEVAIQDGNVHALAYTTADFLV